MQPKAKTANTNVKLHSIFLYSSGNNNNNTTSNINNRETNKSTVDLDRLYFAFAINESSAGTGHPCGTIWHAAANNCVSLKRNGKLIKFASVEQSKATWKSLWVRSYGGGMPNYQLVYNYTCGPHAVTCPGAHDYLRNLLKVYNSQK